MKYIILTAILLLMISCASDKLRTNVQGVYFRNEGYPQNREMTEYEKDDYKTITDKMFEYGLIWRGIAEDYKYPDIKMVDGIYQCWNAETDICANTTTLYIQKPRDMWSFRRGICAYIMHDLMVGDDFKRIDKECTKFVKEQSWGVGGVLGGY